jgi:hypothetical protein
MHWELITDENIGSVDIGVEVIKKIPEEAHHADSPSISFLFIVIDETEFGELILESNSTSLAKFRTVRTKAELIHHGWWWRSGDM